MIRYALLPIDYNLDRIKQELSALNSDWIAHFNSRNYTGEWTILPLRSPGGRADSGIPDLIHADAFIDTPLMDSCPTIKKLVGSLHCEIKSVRLLKLSKGSVIKEHSDAELAFEFGEARLHFPIITNPDVEFYINKERVRMNEGECWYLNANRKHRVANYGQTDRIHIVIDCQVNDWLKKRMEEAEKSYVPELEQLEGWDLLISQIRRSTEPHALMVADDMEKRLLQARANQDAG